MPVFTPPPRQQVLSGLHAKAEQAHNLVEDLQVGSAAAGEELLALASQVLDRARMYQWPRVASWALALEERLAGWSPGQPVSASDIGWLRRHVDRFDEVLDGQPGGTAGLPPPPRAEAEAAPATSPEPAPQLNDPGGVPLDPDEFDVDLGLDGVDLGELGVDAAWFSLEPGDESSPDGTRGDGPDRAEPTAGAEPGPRPSQAPTPPPSELEASTSAEPATPVPTGLEPAPVDRAAETPIPTGEPDSFPREEHPAEETKPTLGRLELQRVRRPGRRAGLELQGPEQFVVVSVSNDPDLHLWLGRVLPERRFELLTARGPAEAELTCRERQPDLLILSLEKGSTLTSQTLRRLRANPMVRYLRVALVAEEANLASRLTAARLGAVGILSRDASDKDVLAEVQLAVLSPLDVPDPTFGEASMEELSRLLIDELDSELRSIRSVVGEVQVPVTGLLGQVLRETSTRLGEGVEQALGGGPEAGTIEVDVESFRGRRALLLESDRRRRAALARQLQDLGLQLLPPVPDLTKAIESGLAWAPDVLIGGAPEQDSLTCIRILRRDIALSSMLWVLVRWDGGDREWPDALGDAEAQRDRLRLRLAEAFAPRAELERRFAAGGELVGRVESCGMPALLRLVMGGSTSALVEVAEGTDRFEAYVSNGQLLDTKWVEADGTVTAGFEAFVRLLGVRRGRFAVSDLEEEHDDALPGTVGELLAAACHWWRPLSLKVDQRLHEICPLELDERRTSELKRQAGKPIRHVVNQLATGMTPAAIMVEGASQAIVASALRELVRRLAVASIPVTGETHDGRREVAQE